jgi:hypothetical protein
VTVVGDPNMSIALSVARGLSHRPLVLPDALEDVQPRAKFILEIDKPLLFDVNGVAQWGEFGAHLRAIAQLSAGVMPGVSSELDRVAIALAMWAGCLMAAKAIAFETLSGTNTVDGRAQAFVTIDNVAAEDMLFRAGVEAAPRVQDPAPADLQPRRRSRHLPGAAAPLSEQRVRADALG